MAKHRLWKEEYWLFLMQLYQKKPTGVKPLYSKGLVDLSLELHISPEYLHEQMFKLSKVTPPMKRLWDKYAQKPQLLARDIKTLRQMNGCGNALEFFKDVEIKESFEKDWEPLASEPTLTPVKLIIILELYFQLIPNTMVPETPEVVELAKQLLTTPEAVAHAMVGFQYCDPYLNKKATASDDLQEACSNIWQRYGNGNPDKLYQIANELKEYFRNK